MGLITGENTTRKMRNSVQQVCEMKEICKYIVKVINLWYVSAEKGEVHRQNVQQKLARRPQRVAVPLFQPGKGGAVEMQP